MLLGLTPQPPSGGCVLKHGAFIVVFFHTDEQPPSGGCVLKLCVYHRILLYISAATFGWLCVETSLLFIIYLYG